MPGLFSPQTDVCLKRNASGSARRSSAAAAAAISATRCQDLRTPRRGRGRRRRRRRRRRSSSRKRRLPPPAGEARALGAPESSAEEPDLGRLLLLAFAASPAGLGAAALERAGQGRVDAAPASCCILAARKAARSRSSRSSSLLRHGLPALRRGGPRRAARGRRGGPG
ncbi:unnamed protein product, partial [Prorocentrum cordatum]